MANRAAGRSDGTSSPGRDADTKTGDRRLRCFAMTEILCIGAPSFSTRLPRGGAAPSWRATSVVS